jgi:hypothetical protein
VTATGVGASGKDGGTELDITTTTTTENLAVGQDVTLNADTGRITVHRVEQTAETLDGEQAAEVAAIMEMVDQYGAGRAIEMIAVEHGEDIGRAMAPTSSLLAEIRTAVARLVADLDAAYAETRRLSAEVVQLRRDTAERDQLRYERRLLGAARMTLDAVAERGPEWRSPEGWHHVRKEAAQVAQMIVDEIGRQATDEPALGPDMRTEIKRLTGYVERMREVVDAARAYAAACDANDASARSGVFGGSDTAKKVVRESAALRIAVRQLEQEETG